MTKAVLFDMDGVLLQSEHIWIKAKTYVLKKYNIPHSRLLSLRTIGLRLDEVVEYWFNQERTAFQKLNIKKEVLMKEITDSVSYYYEKVSHPSEYLEQALNLLAHNNFTLGIASVSPSKLIHSFLLKNSLTHYFEKIVSGESVEFAKPHPEIYLKLASLFSLKPKECIAVEDSLNGLKSVNAAQMRSIFYNPNNEQDVNRLQLATYTIQSFSEFPLHLL